MAGASDEPSLHPGERGGGGASVGDARLGTNRRSTPASGVGARREGRGAAGDESPLHPGERGGGGRLGRGAAGDEPALHSGERGGGGRVLPDPIRQGGVNIRPQPPVPRIRSAPHPARRGGAAVRPQTRPRTLAPPPPRLPGWSDGSSPDTKNGENGDKNEDILYYFRGTRKLKARTAAGSSGPSPGPEPISCDRIVRFTPVRRR